MNSGPMNSSDKNPATEMFDRLQRKTAVPLVLLVATVALVVNGTSIWMFPIIFAVALVYVLIVIGGARLVRDGIDKLRGRDHDS
jgi:hypothetical protein